MKTLDDHWKQEQAMADASNLPSGVECPVCKKELRYDGREAYLTMPETFRAWCDNCDWKGDL